MCVYECLYICMPPYIYITPTHYITSTHPPTPTYIMPIVLHIDNWRMRSVQSCSSWNLFLNPSIRDRKARSTLSSLTCTKKKKRYVSAYWGTSLALARHLYLTYLFKRVNWMLDMPPPPHPPPHPPHIHGHWCTCINVIYIYIYNRNRQQHTCTMCDVRAYVGMYLARHLK